MLSSEEKKQRLVVFMEMQQCTFPATLWKYDAELENGETIFGDPLFQPDYFAGEADFAGICQKAHEGRRMPLVLEYKIGFFWIVAFEEGSIYFLGPYFTGRVSHRYLEQQIDRYDDLSLLVRHQLLQMLTMIPVPPMELIPLLAVQLHCCLHQEVIPLGDVMYCYGESPSVSSEADEAAPLPDHRGVRDLELLLTKMIQEGNIQYRQLLTKGMKLSHGVRTRNTDQLRQSKDSAITMLTIASRAAMNGGLSYQVAYDLNDRYVDEIEAAASITQTQELMLQLLDDYVTRVHLIRAGNGLSREILDTCDYIGAHLKEPLDAQTLAAVIGYAPYYLSRKFQQEMGLSLSTYVRQKRLEAAAVLLQETTKPITAIADEFRFESRSYFTTTFTKQYGMSPAAYRRKLQDNGVTE